MTDVVSIELTLDDALDAAVRSEWEALQAAGLPSLATHTAASNRPHITMVVRGRLADVDSAGIDEVLPLPVTLGAPVLFGAGERRVLARLVVPTAELIALHADLHERVGAGDDLPHTLPGRWTPHVTLARRVPADRLAAALALVGSELRGHAWTVRRWDSATKTVTELAAARERPAPAASPSASPQDDPDAGGRSIHPVDTRLEDAIRDLLAARAITSTICPSDAARAVGTADDWRKLMDPARQAAARLVASGEVEITQGGRVVDLATAKGPIRIRRVAPRVQR